MKNEKEVASRGMEQDYRYETYLKHDTKLACLNTRTTAPEATLSDGRRSYGEPTHLFMIVRRVVSKSKGPIAGTESISITNCEFLYPKKMGECVPKVVDGS